MPATLEAPDRVKCTYADCDLFFPDDRAMRRHKKYSDEHDYCHKCNEDYDSYEDYAMHKILRPDKHDKACRICGDEFKSNAGLKAHTELVSAGARDMEYALTPCRLIGSTKSSPASVVRSAITLPPSSSSILSSDIAMSSALPSSMVTSCTNILSRIC